MVDSESQNLKAGPPRRVTVKRGASESRPWRPWPPSAGPLGYYLHDASCLRSTRLNIMMFSGLQYSFLQFNFMSRNNVSLLEYLEFSSVVECAFSGSFTPSLNREGFRVSFCWIGFCARDDLKHS